MLSSDRGPKENQNSIDNANAFLINNNSTNPYAMKGYPISLTINFIYLSQNTYHHPDPHHMSHYSKCLYACLLS